MKTKKVPLRKCIVCGQRKEKKELIRIVKNSSNDIFIDDTFKAGGRGFYLCRSSDCFQKLKKNKILNKVLRQEIDQKFYDQIEERFKSIES